MRLRSSGWRMGVELTLAVLGLHVLALSVFRRYSLDGLGIPLSMRDPTVALVLIFVLLAIRVCLNRIGDGEPLNRSRRAKPGNWLAGLQTSGLIVAAFCLCIYYVFHHYGGRLAGDGVMNYIYVRSLIIDGDFNLTNEFADFVPDRFQHIAHEARALGLPPDPSHEPGATFLWAPAFIATHGLVRIARRWGADIPADGYSYPYINAVCVSSFLWGFVAVVLSYQVGRRYVDPHLAAVGVGVFWLGSTFFWYTVMEPTMPHATAAAVVSLFLYLWLRVRESPSTRRWIVLCLTGGLMVSIQRYNAFYFIAPLVTAAAWTIQRFKRPEPRSLSKWAACLALVVAAFLLAASPMLLYNWRYSREGSFLRIGESTFRHWKDPRIVEFLFSSNHGLFAWTPIALLAVLGLFGLLRKDRRLAGTLLLTLAGGIYLLSSTWDWYAGYAFGSRRLTEGFFLFALGFCVLSEIALRKPKILGVAALGLLVAWNLLLAGQVKRGEVPMMGTFAFSDTASRAVKRLYEWVGHPSSVPASWPFSWKYGVSPEQFDPTFGHRPYHNLTIDVGSPGDRYFLGHGWSIPEVAPNGQPYRWSVGNDSTWLVPLFGAFDYRVRITGRPSRHPENRRQTVAIEVNGRRAAALTLAEEWQTAEALVPASFWKEGLNELRLLYGWTVEAGSVYGGADDRQVALQLSQLEIRIAK